MTLRDPFPRLFELRDLLPDPSPERAALPAFDDSLMSPGKRDIFERVEADLQRLDGTAWAALKVRFNPWPKKATRPGRSLEPLYDALNEVKAYNYLCDAGFSNVRFIPTSPVKGQKTPDLGGNDHGRQVLCDAKTINRSDDEVSRFVSGGVARSTLCVNPQFLEKVRKTAEHAKKQMLAYDPSGMARMIVYIFVNFDDHETSSSHLAQLESFRATNPVPDIEMVFDAHPAWGGGST